MDSKKVSLKYGLILGGAVVLYSVIVNQLGFGTDKTIANLSLLILPIVLFLAIKKNQEVSDKYTFGAAFGTGFKTTAIATLIFIISTYVYLAFIDPDMVQLFIEQAENELYKRDMPEDQIEMTLEIQKVFMTPGFMAFMGGLFYLFIGTIVSLIIAAIVKKPNHDMPH